MQKEIIHIIGGGPAALMLGLFLDTNRYEVHLYEKNKTLGRKFLVAGDGGLNLTHSEDPSLFITRYTPQGFIDAAFNSFNNQDLMRFLEENEIPLFIGSSKRVFPQKGIKPITVLNKLIELANRNGININTGYEWIGWTANGDLQFKADKKIIKPATGIQVFALGGASWPVTGSDGTWATLFSDRGIKLQPFLASNCSFKIEWKKDFIETMHGKPLKNVAFSMYDKKRKGEAVIIKSGIEGSGVYPFSPEIRKELMALGKATLWMDFKPGLSIEEIEMALKQRNSKTVKDVLLKELTLSDTAFALLRYYLTKEEFTQPKELAKRIKEFPLEITGLAPLEEAISSVGGIPLSLLTHTFELKEHPGIYTIGEMLDYDAPTGGYLLQSCFSMGYFLAKKLNQ